MTSKDKKKKEIPAATICGTYSTYENMKQRDLNASWSCSGFDIGGFGDG